MEYFLTFFQRYSSKPREGGEAAPKKNNEQSIAVIPAQNDVTQQCVPIMNFHLNTDANSLLGLRRLLNDLIVTSAASVKKIGSNYWLSVPFTSVSYVDPHVGMINLHIRMSKTV